MKEGDGVQHKIEKQTQTQTNRWIIQIELTVNSKLLTVLPWKSLVMN